MGFRLPGYEKRTLSKRANYTVSLAKINGTNMYISWIHVVNIVNIIHKFASVFPQLAGESLNIFPKNVDQTPELISQSHHVSGAELFHMFFRILKEV